MEMQLEQLMHTARNQHDEVAALTDRLSDAQFAWRAATERWSIAQHLIHLALTNHRYLDRIDAAVEEARASGLIGPGPYRGRLVARLFLAGLGPPVRLRVKTFGDLAPAGEPSRAAAAAEFVAAQDRLMSSIRNADGIDLGRAAIRSPFLRWLRMSALQAFEAVLLHNARHLWHIEQLRRHGAFPSS